MKEKAKEEKTEKRTRRNRFGLYEVALVLLMGGLVYAIMQTKQPTPTPLVNVCVTNSIPSIQFEMPDVTCSVTNVMPMMDGMKAATDDPEQAKREEADRKALAALFYINHLSMAVTKIKTYNDPRVLEEEYEALSLNSLSLDSINDVEVIDLIQEIMTYITDMRIQERERAMLKEELDQGMSDALYDSLSGISCSGTTPVGIVFSLVTSAASAAANYKRARARVMKEFRKQEWALDKEKMVELNELNKRLLMNYWVLVKRYGIPDEFRVTERDISRFYERLKDESCQMRYRFLMTNQKTYQFLPTYWYYLGRAAYECGHRAEAVNALDTFVEKQYKYANILRCDKLAANCATLRAQILLEDANENGKPIDKNLLRKQLQIIRKNTTDDDWTLRYFCAAVYASQLKDYQAADDAILPVIDELESRNARNVINWYDMMDQKKTYKGTNEVASLVVSGDALYECRTLIARFAQGAMSDDERNRRLKEICDNSNASLREKVFCYGSMGYGQALAALQPDLERVFVYREGNTVCVALPMAWAYSREGDYGFHLTDEPVDLQRLDMEKFTDLEPEKERDIISDDEGKKYVVVKFNGEVSDFETGVFTVRYAKGSKGASQHSYQVALRFAMKDDGRASPSASALGEWAMLSFDGSESVPAHWVNVKVLDFKQEGELQ